MTLLSTPMGLDADGCRSAILTYRRRLRSLTSLLRGAGRLDALHPAHASVAELRALLEADVTQRSTLEGQAGMSALETRVLEPALRQARIALAFPMRADAQAWLAHLQAADACLLVALSRVTVVPGWSATRARARRAAGLVG